MSGSSSNYVAKGMRKCKGCGGTERLHHCEDKADCGLALCCTCLAALPAHGKPPPLIIPTSPVVGGRPAVDSPFPAGRPSVDSPFPTGRPAVDSPFPTGATPGVSPGASPGGWVGGSTAGHTPFPTGATPAGGSTAGHTPFPGSGPDPANLPASKEPNRFVFPAPPS